MDKGTGCESRAGVAARQLPTVSAEDNAVGENRPLGDRDWLTKIGQLRRQTLSRGISRYRVSQETYNAWIAEQSDIYQVFF
jgi:hypothetical protein